jgi:hypothetical protein
VGKPVARWKRSPYPRTREVTNLQIRLDEKPVVGWKNALLCDPEQVLRLSSTPEAAKPVARWKETRSEDEIRPNLAGRNPEAKRKCFTEAELKQPRSWLEEIPKLVGINLGITSLISVGC